MKSDLSYEEAINKIEDWKDKAVFYRKEFVDMTKKVIEYRRKITTLEKEIKYLKAKLMKQN